MNKIEQFKFIEDNYPLYTNHISNRRIRHDFFSKIETELQAYLLGFYAADGNINEKRKTLRIHLQKRDSEIVYLYKDTISPDARVFTIKEHETTGRSGMTVTAHESFGVDITSSKLCTDLVNLGIGYNKTYQELHIPNIPHDLIRHFIRGYFDGDGSFVARVWQPNNRPNPVVKMCISIIAKTPTILNEFIKFFSEYDLVINLNYLKRDKSYRFTTSSKKVCRKIFHILYDDSNFYLSRKFNKFNYYANTEDVQIIADACNAQKMSVNESNNSSTSSEHPTIEDENIC